MLSQFFGFSGRINRAQWWAVQLTMLFIGLGVNLLVADTTAELQQIAQSGKPDPKEALAALGKGGVMALGSILYLIIAQWVFLSSSIQRLHDRNSSGWRILFAYAPLGLFGLAVYFLIVPQAWTAAGLAAMMALAGFGISVVWMTIEFGMLPGDDFENDFGDPPSMSNGRNALEKELAALRGDDRPSAASPAPAMAIAAQPSRMQAASGPVAFGRR